MPSLSVKPTKSAEQVFNETFARITQVIADLGKQAYSEERLTAALSECIKTAFEDVKRSEHGKLVRKLSLAFHSDKLKLSNEPYAVYLKENNAIDILQQCINNAPKAKTPLYEFIETLRLMMIEGERYQGFYKLIHNVLSGIVIVGSGLGIIVAGMVSGLGSALVLIPAYLASFIEKMMLRITTGGTFTKELDALIAEYALTPEANAQAKTLFGKGMRVMLVSNNLINNPNESYAEILATAEDDELIDAIVVGQFNETLKTNPNHTMEEAEDSMNKIIEAMQKTVAEKGMVYLRFLAKALYKSLAEPLPAGIVNKFFPLLAKIATAFVGLVLLVTAAATELFNEVSGRLTLMVTGAFAVFIFASHLVLNSPLYILDGYRAVRNGLTSFFTPSEASAPQESHVRMAGLGMAASNQASNDANLQDSLAPHHGPSPIHAAQKSLPVAGNAEEVYKATFSPRPNGSSDVD